jgi:hypothetical protein
LQGDPDAAGRAHRPDNVTGPGSAAEAEIEMEFPAPGASAIEEETLFVAEMPTAADGNERLRDGVPMEGGLDDRANSDESTTGGETKNDTQIFEDY